MSRVEREQPTTAVAPADLELDDRVDLDPGPAPDRHRGLHRWGGLGLIAALIAVLIAVAAAVSLLLPSWRPPRPPTVVGTRLAEPVQVPLPAGVSTVTDGLAVSLRLAGYPHDEANLLITTPTGVIDPGGRTAALPDDPSGWLRRHPELRITRVDHVRVDGRHSVQVDYRLVKRPASVNRRTVPLFCGPGPAPERGSPWWPLSCSRITPDTRVRATFVPVDGRVLVIEGYWSRPAVGSDEIPAPLQAAYQQVLADLRFVAR